MSERVGTRNEIYTRILDACDTSEGPLAFAAATFELVGAPPLAVQVRGETQ